MSVERVRYCDQVWDNLLLEDMSYCMHYGKGRRDVRMSFEVTSEESKRKKLEAVRRQIVDTLLEIDDLILQVIPQIQVEYVKNVGYLEDDLFKWQIKARRARRQFGLMQAAANRGERAQAEKIAVALEDEFAAWEALIMQRSAEQLELLERFSNARVLSEAESRALKKLHRVLIKRLHPDLHGELPDEAHRFFLIAQSAYENGDIETLRMVATATEEYESEESVASNNEEALSESQLEIDLTMAQAQLSLPQEKLANIKSTPPYNFVELLENPKKLASRRAELKALIEQQKEVYASYKQKIIELGGEVL